MNERENILRLYRHEPVDHLPDLVSGLFYKWPVSGFLERPPYNRGGKDWFGVDWIYSEQGDAPVPDHKKPPMLKDIKRWRDIIKFPNLDEWDWDKAAELDEIDKIDRENKVFVLAIMVGPFERLHALMGFEESMIALLTEEEAVTDFFDALLDYKCRLIDKLSKYYKPDVIHFQDDWGTQKDVFFSPETWRKLFKPQIKKAVDACHNHGILFEMHSCGRIEKIVPDFVDIGVDSWQGMGVINDVAALKKATGDSLAYIMAPNFQKYEIGSLTGELDEAALRSDIRQHVMKLAKGGSYAPFAWFVDEWWYEPMNDEIEKCRTQLGSNL